MKRLIIFNLILFFIYCIACHSKNKEVTHVSLNNNKSIDTLMNMLHNRGQFNGSIIVKSGGKIIYRNAFGESNFKTHEKFIPETISCLGSVTKQFTAMLIMMLNEQHKLSYDNAISKYIPEITKYSNGITIRQLLTHTSGIGDVGDLGIDHPGLKNNEVLKTLSKPESFVSEPGTKYQYSNTGYILLAVIINRVTGKTYKEFLTEKILKPLEMRHTFINEDLDEKSDYVATAYSQFGEKDDPGSNESNAAAKYATGYGDIYSTVDDLSKWDETLYTEKLVRQSTLDTAFTPAKVTEGSTTYGFGWNITDTGGNKVIWHTGSTGGFRAFIERRLNEKVTIIMLTNKGNSKRMDINNAIVNILNNRKYILPKLPISEKLFNIIKETGINAALKTYDSLKVTNDTTYDFLESELNTLGYELLGENKLSDAIAIFKLNTTSYPNSSNAFDSLGDAYVAARNKDFAIKSYQKAIELDKNNIQSFNKLNNLKNQQ